jgi:hypothetical protein
MQNLYLRNTKVTGKATLGEGHFPYFMARKGHFPIWVKAASRTRFLIPIFQPHSSPHSSLFILFPLFAFPFAGAVDKIVLPEGMQTVSFSCCDGLTGTAELDDE